MIHWIVIADASGARLFSTMSRQGPLNLVRELQNPAGRARTQDLVSDEPGKLSKSGAPGTSSAMDPHTTAHDEAAQRFASDLANVLHRGLEEGSYQTVSLVSPPRFLGTLRGCLHKQVDHVVRGSLARDLVKEPIDRLLPHLKSLLDEVGFM